MRRVLICLLVLAGLLCASPAIALDRDKQLHLAAGALISGTTDTLLYHNSVQFSPFERAGISFTVGAAAGLLKEFSDSKSDNHTSDENDFFVTVGGAALGAAVGELTNGLLFVSAYDKRVIIGTGGTWGDPPPGLQLRSRLDDAELDRIIETAANRVDQKFAAREAAYLSQMDQ